MEGKAIRDSFAHYRLLSTRVRTLLFGFAYVFISTLIFIIAEQLIKTSNSPNHSFETLSFFLFLLFTSPIVSGLYHRHNIKNSYLEKRLALLIDNLPVGLIHSRPNGSILSANPCACNLLGYSERELIQGGRSMLLDDTSPEFIEFANSRKQFKHAHGEFTLRKKNGELFPAEITSSIYRDSNNELCSSILIKDLSYVRKLENIKMWSLSALENALSPLMILNKNKAIAWQNRAAAAITGNPLEGILNRGSNLFRELKISQEQQRIINTALKKHASWSGPLTLNQGDTPPKSYKCSLSTVQGKDELIIASFAPTAEASAAKPSHQLDAISKLLNAEIFEQMGDEALNTSKWQDKALPALVVFNIDHFHRMNTAFGIGGGNRIISAFGDLLTRTLPADTLITRLHSDHFVALFPSNRSHFDISKHVDKIRQQLSRPIKTPSESASITVSAGIDLIEDNDRNVRNSIIRAEHAAHKAQELGRDCFCFYRPELSESTAQLIRVSAELREATNANEIKNAYQPIIRATDRTISAVEVLARWHHPVDGILRPATFMPVAEQTGLIPALTAAVIENIGDDFSLLSAKLNSGALCLNISSIMFKEDDFADKLLASFDDLYIPRQKLIVEITESTLMADMARGLQAINTLRDGKVKVVLDHFGHGRSSYSYLGQINVDGIKLDRIFTDDIEHSTHKRTLTKSIVSAARELGIATFVEGVESKEQAEVLCEIGCDYLQGYYFARPALLEEIDRNKDWEKFL